MFINSLLNFLKTYFAIPIRFWISLLHFLYSLKIFLSYFNFHICCVLLYLILCLNLRLFSLLTPIRSVVLQLMFIPFLPFSFATFYMSFLQTNIMNTMNATSEQQGRFKKNLFN